ncbi:hypothetical protein EC988_006922, partial [Linderina pennispora]
MKRQLLTTLWRMHRQPILGSWMSPWQQWLSATQMDLKAIERLRWIRHLSQRHSRQSRSQMSVTRPA